MMQNVRFQKIHFRAPREHGAQRSREQHYSGNGVSDKLIIFFVLQNGRARGRLCSKDSMFLDQKMLRSFDV
eukprot:1152660-Pelagomonas_calceolata.AAC.3